MFDSVISEENLFLAWARFRNGKMGKRDVASFATHVEDHIFGLHATLRDGTYTHGPYEEFTVHDPKRRRISKACVRDRIVHQAVVQVIEPIFERRFIVDSYASRVGKGTHAMVDRVARFLRSATQNDRRPVWVLQCDIRKFFDSIRHDALLSILSETVRDAELMRLIEIIVRSYTTGSCRGRGLPLGNMTSQLFGNAYMNDLDHFVKERLHMRWYARFCDDFLIVHSDRSALEGILPRIRAFLMNKRALVLHPRKVTIRKYAYGVDCVGTVLRPHAQTVRRATIRRAMRTIRIRTDEYCTGELADERYRSMLQSFLGLCVHGSNHHVRQRMQELVRRMLHEDQRAVVECAMMRREWGP
jgi:retron-type reverse transcriptase